MKVRKVRKVKKARPGATALVVNGVRRLDRGLRLAAREVERVTGMSAAQLFVLEQLAREPASSIGDLAARTMTDRSSVSVIVDRLAAKRLVTRVTSEGDRRRFEVRITRAGRTVLERAPTPPTDLLIAALESMPVARTRRLGEVLAALNAKLGFEEAGMLFEE